MDTDQIEVRIPMSEPINMAHVGKLGEEASELARICCVMLAEGSNPDRSFALTAQIANVYAMCGLCIGRFKLDVDAIAIYEQRVKKLRRHWFDRLAHALGAR